MQFCSTNQLPWNNKACFNSANFNSRSPTVAFFFFSTSFVLRDKICGWHQSPAIMLSVPPKAGAVTVITLLRSYFHLKSWDHSVTLTSATDSFKWYWFRMSGFGFNGLAKLRRWLNMSSSARLFSCPAQSCWLLWPSQDVFSRLSCGLWTFFFAVWTINPPLIKACRPWWKTCTAIFFFYNYFCTLHFPFAELSVALMTDLWLNLFHFLNGCHSPLRLKPQCDCNCKGKHTVRCEEW